MYVIAFIINYLDDIKIDKLSLFLLTRHNNNYKSHI